MVRAQQPRAPLPRRDGVVVAVVFAHAEEVDADLVGENRLIEQVADRLGRGVRCAGLIDRHIAEGVEPEFYVHLTDCAEPAPTGDVGRQLSVSRV